MNARNLLVLPEELDVVHKRLHSDKSSKQEIRFTWIPLTLQKARASVEADESAESFLSERAVLERKAKWAGIRRNAKRFPLPKKVWALCLGYIKHVYGYERAAKAVGRYLALVAVASVSLYLTVNPNVLKRALSKLPTAQVQKLVHSGAVFVADRTRPEGQPGAEGSVQPVQVSDPQKISDPKPLTDTGTEPGLPLKLSCSVSSNSETNLKVNP